METPSSSSSRKRPFPDIDDPDNSSNQPSQKRVRFPKGKKVKPDAQPILEPVIDVPDVLPPPDPRLAAKERAARRRGKVVSELCADEDDAADFSRIAAAEVRYQENDSFVDDGIQMEPFNLEKEREEGYFDDAGNFVEYVAEREEKDAWLDSVEADPRLAEKLSTIPKSEEDDKEMSSDDIGQMKRRIANALVPGETVLQALKRLKGNSSNKRAKMSTETKQIFDQLTEDAMRLMENGDYNVYQEEKEVFEREAEGYEALARVRNGEESFDMFADDDNNVVAGSEPTNQTTVTMSSEGTSNQASTDMESQDLEGSWAGQNDYVYDESSGYYYSSNLGYYYDPLTGLYCSASSGQWYKFNEETGSYDEVQAEPEAASNGS